MSEDSLRLFRVRNSRTGEIVTRKLQPMYFDTKKAAKIERDNLKRETGESFEIIVGPDHNKFDGAME